MTLIGDLLNKYAGGRPASSTPAKSSPANPKPAQRSLSTANGLVSKSEGATNTGQKRKAEEDLGHTVSKPLKKAEPSRVQTPSAASKSTNGLCASRSQESLKSAVTQTSKPAITNTTDKAQKATNPPITPPADNPKPKKGSYAEIMQRAKANQALTQQVGIIKHKPVTGGLRKKERRAQLREVVPLSKIPISRHRSKSTSPATKSPQKSADEREPPKKTKPSESSYKGTARANPSTGGYKGTARLNSTVSTKSLSHRDDKVSRFSSRNAPINRKQSRYESEDDESEEDYESDASSDMEAAPFELEEEEQMSLRTAKKEDEEALKEEIRLKKQKEEQKRKLTALAAKRR